MVNKSSYEHTGSDVLGMLGKFAASVARNPANERLEQCFVDIATETSLLNKRVSKEDQVLRASYFQITDYNGNSLEPLLLCRFENHIGSRFPNVSKIIQQTWSCNAPSTETNLVQEA